MGVKLIPEFPDFQNCNTLAEYRGHFPNVGCMSFRPAVFQLFVFFRTASTSLLDVKLSSNCWLGNMIEYFGFSFKKILKMMFAFSDSARCFELCLGRVFAFRNVINYLACWGLLVTLSSIPMLYLNWLHYDIQQFPPYCVHCVLILVCDAVWHEDN